MFYKATIILIFIFQEANVEEKRVLEKRGKDTSSIPKSKEGTGAEWFDKVSREVAKSVELHPHFKKGMKI